MCVPFNKFSNSRLTLYIKKPMLDAGGICEIELKINRTLFHMSLPGQTGQPTHEAFSLAYSILTIINVYISEVN